MSFRYTFQAAVLAFLAHGSYVHASNVWTVNCNPLTVQRSDPILSPGQASGHVHAVVGGTLFQRSMPNDTAVYAKNTTCDKYTDHSNYWCPQLYRMHDGVFDLVPFTGAGMYYTNYTCDYNPTGRCSSPREARAFPPGFRMLAGNSTRRTLNQSDIAQTAILFTSGDYSNVYGLPKKIGDRLQGNVRYPSCWNGQNLTSLDNSHVAYPTNDNQGGMCPKTHPYALINIGAEFNFDTRGIPDPANLTFANGDTTGYGFHGDFLMGWTNATALQQSFANCFDNNNCPWRSFGSPTGKDPNPTTFGPEVSPVYEEEIGLHGSIKQLPGNNPVWAGPVPWRS